MAICRLGPIVQAASGSVGGVVFKNTGSGTILQAKRARRPSGSIDQVNAQRAFAEMSRVWTQSSAEYRLRWSVLAKRLNSQNRLGEPRHMTGRNLFYKSWGPYFRSDGVVAMNQPTTLEQAQIITVYTIFGGNQAAMFILWADLSYDLDIILYAARSNSLGGWRRRCYKFISRRVISRSSCYREWRYEFYKVFTPLETGEHFSLKMYIQPVISGALFWGPIIWDDVANPYKPEPDPWPPT